MVDEHQTSLVDCLIAQSTDLICICDERGTIIKINETFAKSAGKSVDTLIGTLVETLFSDKNEKLNNLLQTKVLNIASDEHFNNTVKENDGSLKCISWHISVFQDLRIIRGAISKSYINNPSLYTDSRLKAIVDNSSDCFFILDRELNIIFQNSAAVKKFSHPQFGADSNVFFASFPEETNRKFFDHFVNALGTNNHLKFVEFSTILNSWFTIDVLPYEDELNILVNDISDRIIDHQINELELKTFELNIAKDRPVNDVLLFLLTAFEKLYPQLHTSILKVEDQKIWHVASPNLPLQFTWAIEGSEISADAGSCGAAAYIKKNVITFDMETDEKWSKYHHLITPYGYKSCWSFPILSNKSLEVMAVFAIYTKVNLIPTENELKSIARICNIVKIIFEDLKQDDILLMMNNRYEMVTMATNDAIYDWNLKTKNVYWSENLLNIFGFTPQEAHQTKNWWLSHIHRDDRAETVAELKSCLREKKSGWVAEYRLKCKNGVYKHVYNRGYIIYDSKQGPKAIIGAIQDITGLKEREIEIIHQNKKLKEIAQIGSHDLRRPVTSILGLVSLFNRQNMADENNTVIVDYLQKASKELDEVIHT
ncbi:MAG TPA: PAS domain S-box protein, partial [Pelobium sp.]|nr:PAS domain S-box protein [Pelobium sp.]